MIHFGTAVAGLVYVCIGREGVGVHITRRPGIDRLRKHHFKTLRSQPQVLDLKGGFPRPVEPLDGKGTIAAGAPAAVRPPDEQRSLRGHLHPEGS